MFHDVTNILKYGGKIHVECVYKSGKHGKTLLPLTLILNQKAAKGSHSSNNGTPVFVTNVITKKTSRPPC